MSFYEMTLVLRQSLSDEEADKALEKYKSMIEKSGGTVHLTENWGKRRLAYEIQKERKATYFLLFFQLAGDAISELNRACRLDEQLIRHLVVKLTKKDLLHREQVKKREAAAKEAVAKAAAKAVAPKEATPKEAAPKEAGSESQAGSVKGEALAETEKVQER